MNRSARVESIDAVEAMRVAMTRFQEDASDALAALDHQINRFLDWLEHDQLQYWQHQVRRASERMAEARANLERKQVMTVGGETPPCYDEKQALARAKQRYRFAEEKIALVKRLRRDVEQEVDEVKGRLGSLGDALTTDVPNAAAMLERAVKSLHAYAEMGRDPVAPSTTASSNDDTTKSKSGDDPPAAAKE